MVIRGESGLPTSPSPGWVIPRDPFLQSPKTGWESPPPPQIACGLSLAPSDLESSNWTSLPFLL